MCEVGSKRSQQALKALLAIGQTQQLAKCRQYYQETKRQDHFTVKNQRQRYFGRHNNFSRRQNYPVKQPSKNDLKSYLKKLDCLQIVSRKYVHTHVLQLLNINQHHRVYQTCFKTAAGDKECNVRLKRAKNGRSLVQISSQNETINVIKQNNYSLNALNLKTIHILQQSQHNNHNCFYKQSLSQRSNSNKQQKLNLLPFLKRFA